MTGKAIIIIPTYNELENIEKLIKDKTIEIISLKSMADFIRKSQTLKTEEVVKA